MAWYPGADRREIRPGENDPPIKPIGIILHVDAGNNPSLFNYFNGPSGGIESHFHVQKVGRPEQYRSTGYEADANYKANSFWEDGVRKGYISVETQGFGAGEWNAHQLAEIKALILWLAETHDIPLRKCRGPKDPGVGYHTQFPDWYPVAKSCPGPDRIRQYNDVLVPWLADAGTPEEDDMQLSDRVNVKGEAAGAVLGLDDISVDGALGYAAAAFVVSQQTQAVVNQLVADRRDMAVRIEELFAAVRAEVAALNEEPPA